MGKRQEKRSSSKLKEQKVTAKCKWLRSSVIAKVVEINIDHWEQFWEVNRHMIWTTNVSRIKWRHQRDKKEGNKKTWKTKQTK